MHRYVTSASWCRRKPLSTRLTMIVCQLKTTIIERSMLSSNTFRIWSQIQHLISSTLSTILISPVRTLFAAIRSAYGKVCRRPCPHGLWLNAPDYDAPTQLLKVDERNTRFADITQTVPVGVLYPMCSMNVAFNRRLIGAAFMQGLMGQGMPWARYDDMFAGWASKVIADHLKLGVENGCAVHSS